MTFEIRMKTPMGVRMEMVDFRRISEHHIYQYSGVLVLFGQVLYIT